MNGQMGQPQVTEYGIRSQDRLIEKIDLEIDNLALTIRQKQDDVKEAKGILRQM